VPLLSDKRLPLQSRILPPVNKEWEGPGPSPTEDEQNGATVTCWVEGTGGKGAFITHWARSKQAEARGKRSHSGAVSFASKKDLRIREARHCMWMDREDANARSRTLQHSRKKSGPVTSPRRFMKFSACVGGDGLGQYQNEVENITNYEIPDRRNRENNPERWRDAPRNICQCSAIR